MTALAFYLIFSGFLSGSARAAHEQHEHAAPLGQGLSTPSRTSGSHILSDPDQRCQRSGGQACYSAESLTRLAESLAQSHDDMADVIRSMFQRVVQGRQDITKPYLEQIVDYINLEERGKDYIEEALGPEGWQELLRNRRRSMEILRARLTPEQRRRVWRFNELLNAKMSEMIAGRNSFHDALMETGDYWSRRVMPRNNPVMPPRDWQRKDPGNSRSWAWGAEKSLEEGNPQEALKQAQKAARLAPSDPAIKALMADALFHSGKIAEAARLVREVLSEDPGNERARRLLPLVKGRDEASSWEEPRKLAEASGTPAAPDLQATPSLVPARLSPVKVMAQQGGPAPSRHDYSLEANSRLKIGDYSGALGIAEAGLAGNARSPSLWLIKARALLEQGRYREALAAAEQALSLDPDSAFAHYARAWALAGLGRDQEALDSLARAAELNPAEYRDDVAQARELSEGELLELFSGKPRARPAPASAARRGIKPRFALLMLAGLLGGTLLALPFLFRRRGGENAPAAVSTRDPLLRGQYRTVRKIGTGGMGVVYEGLDVSLNRPVAIKMMREEIKSNPRERERFINEAKLVASLHHPNIVDIYAVVEEGEDIFLVFEFVEGRTIHELLSSHGPLKLRESLAIFRNVALALDHAHRNNVIHRDLKPSNIMVTEEGHAKVMDFGVARMAKDTALRYSMTNTVVGTPPYMAPEQERGVVRRESDFFALGVCLYEMLSGQIPFQGEGMGMLLNKAEKKYTPLSQAATGIPSALDRVLDQAFEPDPAKRFVSSKEFLLHFEGAVQAALKNNQIFRNLPPT
ncbi:MAG: protein kinase [Elusimicrobia bacterium]|nr:protein kinase [Elusimicrobiota bacterium]